MEDWADLVTLGFVALFVVTIVAVRHWFWR